MTYAYGEQYLDDAMNNLGEAVDYAVYACHNRPLKGDIDNGAAVIVIAFKKRVSDLILVTLVYLRKPQRVKTLVKHTAECTRIGLAILRSGKTCVLVEHAKTTVVRLCSLRSRAESVMYLLYRYSIVNHQ